MNTMRRMPSRVPLPLMSSIIPPYRSIAINVAYSRMVTARASVVSVAFRDREAAGAAALVRDPRRELVADTRGGDDGVAGVGSLIAASGRPISRTGDAAAVGIAGSAVL
jgi:hypothetical protein